MGKTIVKPIHSTLIIRDQKGREANRYKVEVFVNAEGDFGVRFLEGELMKGLEATISGAAAADALGERKRALTRT